jgi:hypothetical protein
VGVVAVLQPSLIVLVICCSYVTLVVTDSMLLDAEEHAGKYSIFCDSVADVGAEGGVAESKLEKAKSSTSS